jgi:hypothetical protein
MLAVLGFLPGVQGCRERKAAARLRSDIPIQEQDFHQRRHLARSHSWSIHLRLSYLRKLAPSLQLDVKRASD